MASSSTTSSKESTDQNEKSNQWSTTVEERKQYSSTSRDGEEIIEEQSVTFVERTPIEQQDELSPHPIQKQSFTPFAAACISSRSSPRIEAEERGSKLSARPFDEFLVTSPNTDTPPGTNPKPGDQASSSSIKRT